MRLTLYLLAAVLAACVIGCCLPGRAHGQGPAVYWIRVDADNAALFLHGRQIGVYTASQRAYRSLLPESFGQLAPCPVAIPAELQPAPAWQTAGVQTSEPAPRVKLGGDPEPYGGPLSADTRTASKPAPSPSPPIPEIPRYQDLGAITVVTDDTALRERILNDLHTAPELEKYRGQRITAFPASAPQLAEFKLDQDSEYQRTGLAILVQPAPDALRSAPVTTLHQYTDPGDLAAQLEAILSEYEPSSTGYMPWRRIHVGLAVGLCVGAVICLFTGVSLSWHRS